MITLIIIYSVIACITGSFFACAITPGYKAWALSCAVLWPIAWLVFVGCFIHWGIKGNH